MEYFSFMISKEAIITWLFILFQIVVSVILIYNRKVMLSCLAEIGLSFVLYYFFLDKLSYVIFSYVFMKIVLVILIYFLRVFSFYAISSIANKGVLSKCMFVIFGKKRFTKFVSCMLNKVDYGITLKKGVPGMVLKVHKATKVPFDINGFPIFKSYAKVKLKWSIIKKDRETHFRYANKVMARRIMKNKFYALKFKKKEIEAFKKGETPSSFTWHHHQNRGVMQLVNRNIHDKVYHKGGFSIWGKES